MRAFHIIVNTPYFWLYADDEFASRDFGSPQALWRNFMMAVFHLLVTGLLFWFGILPLIDDTVVSAELSTMYIALTVFVALQVFYPSFTAFHVVSNTWLRLLAKRRSDR